MKLNFCPLRTDTKGKTPVFNETTGDDLTAHAAGTLHITLNHVKAKRCLGCHATVALKVQPGFGVQSEGDGFSKLFLIAPLLLWVLISSIPIKSFGQKVATRMVRAYMDNDFFAYQQQDGAYTNGIRLDYFYENNCKGPPSLPGYFTAGPGARQTSSIGVMQVMITPNDILEKKPSTDDYPYSGALFLSHAVNSINSYENRSVKTEYTVGVIGPLSGAGETQRFVHHVLNFNRPVGWETQFRTNVFANINISGEKMLYERNGFQVIGGAELDMGTLETSAALNSTIRAGRMPSYFSGYINQYTSSDDVLTAYLFVKPQVQYMVHNTILEGTTLNWQSDVYAPNEFESATGRPTVAISHELVAAKAGVVVAYHGFGFSATYTHESGWLRHQPAKGYGNISLYFGLSMSN